MVFEVWKSLKRQVQSLWQVQENHTPLFQQSKFLCQFQKLIEENLQKFQQNPIQ